MAYVALADFRTATPLAEYCAGLPLTTTEAPDTALTAAIARLSRRLDEACNDHFESESLTLDLDGSGHRKLILPHRCTAATTVSIRDDAGDYTAQATSDVYHLHSSLFSSGSRKRGHFDWLDVLPEGTGLSGLPSWSSPFYWPRGSQTVRVAGTFGWTTTPGDIKRALALLVYDHFKPLRADLRRADRWSTADVSVVTSLSGPFGIPEADQIVEEYRRDEILAVA